MNVLIVWNNLNTLKMWLRRRGVQDARIKYT